MRAAAPGAAILVLGPPDMGARTPATLLAVIEGQRRAAARAGVAFFDQLAAMGGPDRAAAWRAQCLYGRDLVHLGERGYERLADALI